MIRGKIIRVRAFLLTPHFPFPKYYKLNCIHYYLVLYDNIVDS